MENSLGTTNQDASSQGMSFVFPPYGNVGPPFLSTLSLLGFTIGLLVVGGLAVRGRLLEYLWLYGKYIRV